MKLCHIKCSGPVFLRPSVEAVKKIKRFFFHSQCSHI